MIRDVLTHMQNCKPRMILPSGQLVDKDMLPKRLDDAAGRNKSMPFSRGVEDGTSTLQIRCPAQSDRVSEPSVVCRNGRTKTPKPRLRLGQAGGKQPYRTIPHMKMPRLE